MGLDPIKRLDVYITKDLQFGTDEDRETEFIEEYGIKGVGKTVSAEWASAFPEYLRGNDHGHAAPEKCLAAHLLNADDPVHLEVCNAGFEHNVRQRLEGAVATDSSEYILDPRGVCLWIDGVRSETAFERLYESSFAFPKLAEALVMLGADEEFAEAAAASMKDRRRDQHGPSVRADVV